MSDRPAVGSAVRVVLVAAVELPLVERQELLRLVTEHIVEELEAQQLGRSPAAVREARFIAALRDVAAAVTHPPSSTEYIDVYTRRRAAGDAGLPSASAITKHFKSWAAGLTAAGLTGSTPLPSHQYRRSRRGSRSYIDERITDCIKQCARDRRRVPTTSAYVAWREEQLTGAPGRRPLPSDIPCLKTIYLHFNTWPDALEASGLPRERGARAAATAYLPVGPATPKPHRKSGSFPQ